MMCIHIKFNPLKSQRDVDRNNLGNIVLFCLLTLLSNTSNAEEFPLRSAPDSQAISVPIKPNVCNSSDRLSLAINNSVLLQETEELLVGSVMVDMSLPYSNFLTKKISAELDVRYHFNGGPNTRGSLVILLDGKPVSYTSMHGFSSTVSSSLKRLPRIELDNEGKRVTILCMVKRLDSNASVSCSLDSICLYDMNLKKDNANFDCTQ